MQAGGGEFESRTFHQKTTGTMTAYYNENNLYAAQWLRNLIDAGLIAPGDVDSRSITNVSPDDLNGYTQCHFFAGIGGWSHALRRAGWDDDRPVWTGSAPCQPWSVSGKGEKFDDDRHLFPVWANLIRQQTPAVVFGEQVASPDGLLWWDYVAAEFEDQGYAAAPTDLCAAGVGAPHIRQRLFFVAEPARDEYPPTHESLVHALRAGSQGRKGSECLEPVPTAATGLGDDSHEVEHRTWRSATNGFWADADWIRDRDGLWRPVEPGTQPMADGPSERVGRLHAYGNAIVAPLATMFIQAYMATL